MGFVTESSMRTDYRVLFSENINADLTIVAYLTKRGILVEVVESEIDSQSVNETVIFQQLIDMSGYTYESLIENIIIK